jgi:hypothetical protein
MFVVYLAFTWKKKKKMDVIKMFLREGERSGYEMLRNWSGLCLVLEC